MSGPDAFVLTVNVGSSSIKFAVYPAADMSGGPVIAGTMAGLEPGGQARAEWRGADGAHASRLPPADDPDDPFASALESLRDILARGADRSRLVAVAHRVVHGGGEFRAAVLIDDRVLGRLKGFAALAPLHQPHNVKGIEVFRAAYPAVPQVACFDTAFHADMPPEETRFALDPVLVGEELRRYGFHGLSYQSVHERLSASSRRAGDRLLMAHLGNGASLCAARGGTSVATTMGFTPLDGLMMGTRCGALDPGAVLHLLARGWTAAAIEDLLYRRSGLKGVSGLSADMRTLRASDSPRARFAVELFTHRVVREAGALTAVLGGLDVLAFTGGIGEHDNVLRSQVCARLAYLGLRLDAEANRCAQADAMTAIHSRESAVEIWVVPADEGRVAAQAALHVVSSPA